VSEQIVWILQCMYSDQCGEAQPPDLIWLDIGIARFIIITYVSLTVNGDVCFALCLVHHPASIGVCHGMRFCTFGTSACVTSNNGFICKAGLKHASSITGDLLVM
ncbi:unnamed protein product, partial [Symbiodinium natans]